MMKWHIFYRIFSVKIVGSVKSWKKKKKNILVLQDRSQIYWLIAQISNQILLTMLQTIAAEPNSANYATNHCCWGTIPRH